jgi:large subunit ribosomal protein L3
MALESRGLIARSRASFLPRQPYKRDGTAFGPQKAFVQSTLDLERWATRLGYSQERLEELHQKGLLKKILQDGMKGNNYQWYDKKTGWTRGKSKRVGVLAVKLGMKMEKDWWGTAHAVTVLQLLDNVVTQVKTEENEGYTALQVGAGLRKLKKTTKPMMGHFAKAKTAPKLILREFQVSADALVPLGTPIYAQHFKPGQFLDIRAKSKGKGFQGAMRRHGMSGGYASHGQSVTHRSMGSTGMNQFPGHVFKGKPMPGRMGGEWTKVYNLRLLKVNTEDQALYVLGSVPGPKGAFVEVTDAMLLPHPRVPPFPTFFRKPGVVLPRFLHWRFPDPYKQVREIDWDLRASEAVAALKAAQAAGEAEDAAANAPTNAEEATLRKK